MVRRLHSWTFRKCKNTPILVLLCSALEHRSAPLWLWAGSERFCMEHNLRRRNLVSCAELGIAVIYSIHRVCMQAKILEYRILIYLNYVFNRLIQFMTEYLSSPVSVRTGEGGWGESLVHQPYQDLQWHVRSSNSANFIFNKINTFKNDSCHSMCAWPVVGIVHLSWMYTTWCKWPVAIFFPSPVAQIGIVTCEQKKSMWIWILSDWNQAAFCICYNLTLPKATHVLNI